MTTITVWLLISLNSTYASAASGVYTTLGKFATLADCQHVQRSLPQTSGSTGITRCVQATIVKE